MWVGVGGSVDMGAWVGEDSRTALSILCWARASTPRTPPAAHYQAPRPLPPTPPTRCPPLNPAPQDLEAGRYRPVVEDAAAVGEELGRAQDKLGRVVALLEGLRQAAPHLAGELDKVLCHVADVRA